MSLIEVKNLYFNYGDKQLYNDVSFSINRGEHCCLVGLNGSGKTTIFDLLLKNIIPDSGSINWTNGVKYAYLDQHLNVDDKITAFDFLYNVYAKLFSKEKEMENLFLKSSQDSINYEKFLTKALAIQDELMMVDFYSIKERTLKLVDGLGISQKVLSSPMINLSSGQKEKIFLARMLLDKNDLLLLDEPTNFLDVEQIEWLSNYLNNFDGAFFVISHDKQFLRKISQIVFCLENCKITRYKGDYDYFLVQNDINKDLYDKRFTMQQKYIKKEEEFIKKNIARATSSSAAKSRRTRLEKVDKLSAPTVENTNFDFSFNYSKDVGNQLLQVKELSFGYNNIPLTKPLSFTMLRGQKVAIRGKNGVGKTTLVRTLLSKIDSISGSFDWLKGLEINYFNQDEFVDLTISPFIYLKNCYPDLNHNKIISTLARFGIKKTLIKRKMDNLSGGEICRTRLALLSLKKTNFLILDEPTNHLDKASKIALFESIKKFKGGVLIVCHEKDFYKDIIDYEILF